MPAKVKRYIPKIPTTGWLYSECERLGFQVRGSDINRAGLVAILVERGYDVAAGKKTKRKVDR